MYLMLDRLSRQAHNKLIKHNQTISVAESCTGGELSSELTKHPGASNYFLLGVVAYSNDSKEKILGIPVKIISKYGAVCRRVAVLMAQNIRKKTKADLGISITGIAGPDAGKPDKPIGTVFICLSARNKNICREFSFRGRRKDIRRKSTQEALRLLCAHLSQ